MPEITVSARDCADRAVLLRERVTSADFESSHFAAQLVERLAWAVADAHLAERAHGDDERDAQLAEAHRHEPDGPAGRPHGSATAARG
jgi:hypothetical protein